MGAGKNTQLMRRRVEQVPELKPSQGLTGSDLAIWDQP